MSTRHGDSDPLVDPGDTALAAFAEQVRQPGGLSAVPARDPAAQLVVVQPHPDDGALSVGGTLLTVGNPLKIVTVYSRAATASASRTRQAEDRRFAELVGADWQHLDLAEGSSMSAPRPHTDVEAVASALRSLSTDGEVLVGPAAVARHVDHWAAQQAIRSLDAAVFWEDVAFWSIYGASIEDRVQFSLRDPEWLAAQVLVAVDITDVVRDKAALLACYPSQSTEIWRPLRYGWVAARELGRTGYCERLFIGDDHLDAVARALRLQIEPGPVLQYGTAPIRTAWATPAAPR